MKTTLAGIAANLAVIAALAALPAHADSAAERMISKCKSRDGTVTYTDTNCYRYGRTQKLKLSDATSYNSAEATAANLKFASLVGAENNRVRAETAASQAAADAAMADSKRNQEARAAREAKLNITPLPDMQFDRGVYTVATKK